MKIKYCLIAAALSLGPLAGAHELDEVVSPEQIQLAKDLPGTIVVRVNKANPNDVAVLHVKEKLPPGQKLGEGANFEKIALKGDTNQLVFEVGKDNERDVTSSTPALRYAYGGGGFAVRGPNGGVAVGGYRGGAIAGGGYGCGYGYRGGAYGGGYGYGSGYGGEAYGYGNYADNYAYGTYYPNYYY